MNEKLNAQLIKLTLLLQLERRARQAPSRELPYVLVNETTELIPYRQAVLWLRDENKIDTVSGVAKPEANSPLALWLNKALKAVGASDAASSIFAFNRNAVGADLTGDWSEWLPENGLWLPLPANSSKRLKYVLVLFRDNPWLDAEIHLLSYLTEAYGHALAMAEAGTPAIPWRERWLKKKKLLQISALLLAILFFPLRQSVLAEAEVIAAKPNMVRAPLEGIVETFYVQPNEEVKTGQKLFSLDKAELHSRLLVARKKRDAAHTDYLQTTQEAMLDPAVKYKLAGLKSKWEQEAAEAEYVTTLLQRCDVSATIAGVAVFDDPNEWLGRPVKQGEKILAVADPGAVELEIRLPMEDLLVLEPGAEALFFPNITPHKPQEARLNYFSYRATPTPADIMSYRLKAAFTGDETLPRLGYRGTAKVYGKRWPFLLWLLRKPIQTLRLWLTL